LLHKYSLFCDDECHQWHDNVCHESIDDHAESGANHDTDRQIDHVSPDGEFLEFAKKTSHFTHGLLPTRFTPISGRRYNTRLIRNAHSNKMRTVCLESGHEQGY